VSKRFIELTNKKSGDKELINISNIHLLIDEKTHRVIITCLLDKTNLIEGANHFLYHNHHVLESYYEIKKEIENDI